nr:hypothetical protein CFP56_48799 [Quercus suber]
MGLHHEYNHGRVLRGLEARKHLEMTKRDSHGSEIKMHVPDGFADKQAVDDSGVDVVYNVVYVTASADFTGSTAGYSTVNATPTTSAPTAAAVTSDDAATTPTATAKTSAEAAKEDDLATDSALSSATATSSSDDASLPLATASTSSVIPNKTLFLNPPASATAATTSARTAATSAVAAVVAGTPLAASHAADQQVGNTSQGMSGGAKAGLAFGIIIGFALVAGLLFFCWRRRKNPNAQEELNEKRTSSIFGGKAPEGDNRTSVAPSLRSTRTASTAPRLSLRPVTQFLPNLTENRKSTGNLLGIGGAAPMSEKPKSTWERRPVGSENPFGDNNNNEKQDRIVSPPANPFDEPEGAVANSKRSSAESNGSSKSGSEPMTPKSNVGVAVAAPMTPQGPNNVHRVQLDFKPSMEDELELKSGQLVRMLHEYDDGWV